MSLSHRVCMFLAGLVLALVPPLLPVQIPDIPVPGPAAPPTALVTLPTDLASRRKLEAARDYINVKDWGEAVRLLQALLDAREDTFVQTRTAAGTAAETTTWSSVRGEAERLLGEL